MKSTTDIAFLLIRVGLALVFIAHSIVQLSAIEKPIAVFASIGFSAVWAYIVAYVELIGGISMLAGFATGWSGVLLATIMVGSIAYIKIHKGFVGGYELELILFLSSIAISLGGPGSYTIKSLFGKGGK